jgi:hypothetical protein
VLFACSSGSPTSTTVGLPTPVSPDDQVGSAPPVDDSVPDSTTMTIVKSAGSVVDEAIRGHAVVVGVAPSALSVPDLETALAGAAGLDPAVTVAVVRGRVQVTSGAESVCLLLPGDPELPAFLEERPCS